MSGKHAFGAAAAAAVITAIAALLATFIIVFGDDDAAMSYRSLDYEVTVQSDGDLEITQHVDLRLNEREDDDDNTVPWKQLYQQYRLTPDNLTAITGVSVTDASTGETYAQTDPRTPSGIGDDEWNTSYARHWYIADVTDGADDPQPYVPGGDIGEQRVVEIGWDIPVTVEADSMRFDVTMTFEGVTTAYDDVATFQWEPFGPSSQVPIGTVTGTVRLPDGGDGSLSRAWLHFSGTSETSRSNNVLQFTAYDVRAGQHLDLVAMVDVNATDGVVRTASERAADRIIDDESRQERQWHESQQAAAIRRVVIWAVLAVVGVALIIWGVIASIRSNREADSRGGIEYWRDPPEISPASAARLLSIVQPDAAGDLQTRQMSSSVLSLADKRVIGVRPGPADLYDGSAAGDRSAAISAAQRFPAFSQTGGKLDDTVTITLDPAVASGGVPAADLSQSEEAVLSMLQAASKRCGSATFDLERMNAAFEDDEDGYELQEAFDTACANEFALLGATRAVGGQALAAGILGVAVALATFLFSGAEQQLAVVLVLGCPLLFGSAFVLCSMRRTGLTEEGRRLSGQVVGLKRYLEDFSDFSDRGVADLTLWDRYLVYAAAFGISDTVLKQLAEAYPELCDPSWLDSYATGHVVYWAYRPYWYAHTWSAGAVAPVADVASFSANVGNIGAHLDAGFADIASMFQAAAPGSSGVSGGSFSGGGFGGSSGGSGGGSFGGR